MGVTRQRDVVAREKVVRGTVAIVLAVLVIGTLIRFYTRPDLGTAVVAGLTALAITWYTFETARMRARADDSARRENTPTLQFELGFPAKPGTLDVRCIVINRTRSIAVIRATVRARIGGRDLTVQTGPYSGNEDWIIWAADAWNAHVDLGKEFPWPRPEQDTPATETVPIELQVAVYNSRGAYQYLFRREYHVEIYLQRDIKEAWPHTTPRTFLAPAPIPESLSLDPKLGLDDLP
jgi:hypothetical protein